MEHKGTVLLCCDSDFSDLLTSYTKEFADGTVQTNTYVYDNFVNPTKITKTVGTNEIVWKLVWQHGRQLDKITDENDNVIVEYDYDENGLRTYKKQADGSEHFYYYSGSRLEFVKILDANGDLTCSMRYIYNSSGQAEYILYRGANYATAKQYALFYILRDSEGKIHKLLQVRKKSGSGVAAMLEESVIYHYDPYGKLLQVEQPKGDVVGNYNPLIYKDYVYDFDTELYYLQSRYYDAEVGRFLNADAFASTGQGVIDTNMFAYCGNNPISRQDSNGAFWKEIGNFFSNAWKGINTWAKNTFGAGSSTTATIAKIETQVIPDPSPITIKTGTKSTQTVSQYGNTSKLISVYANQDVQHPVLSSTAGVNINIADFTLNISVGLDNIGVSGSLSNANTTNSFGVKVNLSEFKLGLEGSTAIQWDNTTETTYTNASVSGWAIIALYYFLNTGEYVESPSAYAY